jgi:branched-chain amino acid transport system ATP-binding protein
MARDIILATEDLTKEFAGFVAVSSVSLEVERGSIHALIGPNGAGKTTCFNLLSKFLQPTRGRILFRGEDITGLDAADVARLGLVRSFQISAVFPHMTVLENVRIALQRKRGASFDFWRSAAVLNEYNARALELIADVGLSSFAHWPAVELPYGRKRALEIATTLALDPDMLLLDEPMAGMGPDESGRMLAMLRELKGGITILLIEHDMETVFALADRITVLVYGRVIASGDPAAIRADAAVREAYLGEQEGTAHA